MTPKAFVIGILLDDMMMHDWQYVALERVQKSGLLERVVLLLDEAFQPSESRSSAYHFFDAIDARLSRTLIAHDAFARRDVRELFPDADVYRFSSREEAGVRCLAEPDIAAITDKHFCLLISAKLQSWHPALYSAARWGVWSYRWGDPQRVRGGPSGFHECIDGHPTTGASLEMHRHETAGGTKILDTVISTTYFYSPRVNRQLIHRSACSLLSRQLEKLARLGEERYFTELDRRKPPYGFYVYPQYHVPTGWRMWRVWAIYMSRILRKALSDRLQWEKWYLLVNHSPAQANTLNRYTEIATPPGEYWADPFLWERDGKTFIFMEVFSRARQKGHLAVAEITRDYSVSAPVTILEAPYHLSYPCLLEHDDNLYMIPESKDNHAVSIYRCSEFPHRWEFVMHLLEGISAVDTTPFFHQGKWWLFMTVVDTEGARARENLCLYYADTLLTQQWTPHPLNPVVTDTRYARPAGHLRVEGNRLFRPAQDCSNTYGYAIAFREIKTLTVDDYEEVTSEAIYPAWSRGLVGTHTFSRLGEWTVMDVCRRVFNHPCLQLWADRWR